MGFDPTLGSPFFFMEPAYPILQEGGVMAYPGGSNDRISGTGTLNISVA